ncbi:zinc finger and BTB domain-containing protein 41-like [Gigantopelta aegis]|uniref:zinc finger and BTB domain-containing protein 41-like n=1 Tax=Gigantopelta aegis TaxID=1735272 RepID=UPI001B888E80|nr:zinc finger and BTB domain-containing protein 41-like [Gigantopelta aegis]
MNRFNDWGMTQGRCRTTTDHERNLKRSVDDAKRKRELINIGCERDRWADLQERLGIDSEELAAALMDYYELHNSCHMVTPTSETPAACCSGVSNTVAQNYSNSTISDTNNCHSHEHQNGDPYSVSAGDKEEDSVNNNNEKSSTSESLSVSESLPSRQPDVMCTNQTNQIESGAGPDSQSDATDKDEDDSGESFCGYQSLDEDFVTFRDSTSEDDLEQQKKKKKKKRKKDNDVDYEPKRQKEKKKKSKQDDDDAAAAADDEDSEDRAADDESGDTDDSFGDVSSKDDDHKNLNEKPAMIKNADNEYVCTVCPAICFSDEAADAHLVSHSESWCEKCDKQCLSVTCLKAHQSRCQGYSTFTCLFSGCEYTVRSRYAVFKHTVAVHSKEKLFECALCSFDTSLVNGFVNHIKTSHYISPVLKKGRTSCEICGTKFRGQRVLREHKRSIHGIEVPELQAICEVCGKVFKKNSLKSHMNNTHLDQAVPCEFDGCSSIFVTKMKMKQHYRHVHLGIKAVKCPFEGCSYGCHSKCRMDIHYNMVHLKVRSIPCTWPGCDKRFYRDTHLAVHLRIHSDEKPLSCELCEYRCRQRAALNWHMNKQHKPEVCDENGSHLGGRVNRVKSDTSVEVNIPPAGVPAVTHARKPGRKGKKEKN